MIILYHTHILAADCSEATGMEVLGAMKLGIITTWSMGLEAGMDPINTRAGG